MKNIRIAFDFDKVFVDYPPLIPSALINYLYKKRNHNLSYRIPGPIEKRIRIFSHTHFLRHPIKENIHILSEMFDSNKYLIFLISSRFSFLRGRTEEWDKRHKISRFFKEMYFNFKDEQPHLFKDRIIKEGKIEKFIDDDLDLLFYLAERNPNVDFYWLGNFKPNKPLPKNIMQIKTLSEIKKYV